MLDGVHANADAMIRRPLFSGRDICCSFLTRWINENGFYDTAEIIVIFLFICHTVLWFCWLVTGKWVFVYLFLHSKRGLIIRS